MAQALMALARCAAAMQATRTAAAAGPVRLLLPSAGLTAPQLTQQMVRWPEARGSFMPVTAARPFRGRKLITYPWTGALNLEDLPWWGEMVIKGGQTPTGGVGAAGSKTPYVWTYTGDLTSDTLKAMTYYYADNERSYVVANSLVNGFSITADTTNDQPIMVTANLIGPNRSEAAWTAPAESPRTALSPLMSAVTVDTTSFTATPMSLGVKSWSLNVQPGWVPQYGASGALVPEEFQRGYINVSASLVMRVNTTTAGEITAWLANTERLIRFTVSAGFLDSAIYLPSTTHKATFDIAGYWSTATPGLDGPVTTITLATEANYSTADTLSNFFRMIYTGNQLDYISA